MKRSALVLLGVLSLSAFLSRAEITSMAGLEAFTEDLTPRKDALSLTGTVLSVQITSKLSQIVLADDQGHRVELFRFPDLEQPTPGDTIKVSGFAYMGKSKEFFFSAEDDFETLEKGDTPEPVPVRLSETNADKHHLLTISTEGTIVESVQDEMDSRYRILMLKDEGCVIPITIPLNAFGTCEELIGARIRVKGIYRRSVSGIRKFSCPSIHPTLPTDLEVITPPPEDPFSAPPIEKRFYLSTEDVMRMSSRTVEGEVLAIWSGKRAMVRADDKQIVNLEFADGVSLPPCGAMIIAAGQPETDLFRINLTAVRWKDSDLSLPLVTNETPASAVTAFWNANGRNSINGDVHGKLLSVTGVIRTLPAQDDEDLRFVIDSNGLQIPVDITANPALCDELILDSKVRVTGRCLLLTDAWRPGNVFPQAKGFVLIARSQDDIVLVSKPSWWTPARLIILIAILLLALAAVGAWNLIQRHLAQLKIAERTRLAVELHDSLSQNLAGVAFQVASGKNAIDEDPETAKKRIQASERMLLSCRTELRQCLFDHRSDMLEETDFTAAIRKALSQLKDATSVKIRFNARRADFPDPDAHAILCVIRELTANAIRHGHATSVKIAGSTENGKLLFSVTDNGCGFDPQNCVGMAEGHFGISGMRDRLKRLKGEIILSSTPGKGTKALATVPMTKA